MQLFFSETVRLTEVIMMSEQLQGAIPFPGAKQVQAITPSFNSCWGKYAKFKV
jgi:hypothetical protein